MYEGVDISICYKRLIFSGSGFKYDVEYFSDENVFRNITPQQPRDDTDYHIKVINVNVFDTKYAQVCIKLWLQLLSSLSFFSLSDSLFPPASFLLLGALFGTYGYCEGLWEQCESELVIQIGGVVAFRG